MFRSGTVTIPIAVVIFLSIFLQSNNAAPTALETDPITNAVSPEQSESGDEEVIQLEHLRHPPAQNDGANTKEEILPQLEKQLEQEAEASALVTASNEEAEDESGNENNRDETDDNDNNSDYEEKIEKASENMLLKTLAEYHHKQQQEQQQRQQQQEQHTSQHYHFRMVGDAKEFDAIDDNSKLMKLLPGSARLTFGQHYGADFTTTPAVPKATDLSQPEVVPNSVPTSTATVTRNGQRRGDNAEVLLRHSGGQYSAFDMAQYVFWTGDEAGVARAVEELIQKGLMTRENAIKFLHDIRLGIDYLQNTYSSHPFKTDRTTNANRGHDGTTYAMTEPSVTAAPTEVETIVSPHNGHHGTVSPEILKVIERLPRLLKLNQLGEQIESTQDYDDVVGRLRVADFLYAEYSLEEVIYQLAKVMFTQSLTRGSEPAQHALQKLTEFLESEGTHGRISPVLQKKILDVLLAALADTLAENPELMDAARTALGKHMDKISLRAIQNNH